MSGEKHKFPVEFQCPYCGHENKTAVEATYFQNKQIVYCDCETGGCDRMLVITYVAYVEVKTHALVDQMEESRCQHNS